MQIEGAVALVTGGASGLGEATVRRLHARGASTVIVDKNAERGTALAKELGNKALFCETDVTSAESAHAAVNAATELGALRIAVNCAGSGMAGRTIGRDGTPHDLSVFEWVIKLNLIGTFNVASTAASAMSKNEPNEGGERGVIVNTASIAAFDGQIGQVAYSASKGGVVGMTLPMARDLGVVGIRVMTIAPGSFETPIFGSGAGADAMKSGLTALVPFPTRMGDPDEYAQLAQHIVENAYLNGEVIRIDGAVRFPPK
ncbi:MAG TPA: SDR family NAD(P)-dependent oxidoreductase [Acidimicrobiia bacterium]|jgi:NAD(P)-dependent dehydrogenase (short-subunit alcohol dehydrogenase family)